jgi:hypothetical protein
MLRQNDFENALAKATDFTSLLALAPKADEGVASEKDEMIPEAIQRVMAVITAAEKYVGDDLKKLKQLGMSFSNYSNRLLTFEVFIQKKGLKDVCAAATMSDMIKNSMECVCADCHPKAMKLLKIIIKAGRDFIPNSDSSVEDLINMCRFIDVPENDKAEFSDEMVERMNLIVESAKKFSTVKEITAVSRLIPSWKIANKLIMDFLTRVGVHSVDDTKGILEATDTESNGGKDVVNEIIRQMVVNCPEGTDYSGLLKKSKALGSNSGELILAVPMTPSGVFPGFNGGSIADFFSR